MTTIGAFFQKECKAGNFSSQLLQGEIQSMAVNRADRSVTVSVRFSQFVEYGDLQKLARQVESPGVRRVELRPVFPGECFSAASLGAACTASVPELRATACFTPINPAISSSSASTFPQSVPNCKAVFTHVFSLLHAV